MVMLAITIAMMVIIASCRCCRGRGSSRASRCGACARGRQCGYSRSAIGDEISRAKCVTVGIGDSCHPGVGYRRDIQIFNSRSGNISSIAIGLFRLVKELSAGCRICDVNKELPFCEVRDVEISRNPSCASIGIQDSVNRTCC